MAHSHARTLLALAFASVLCLLPLTLLAQFQGDFPLHDPPNAAGSLAPDEEPIRFIGNYCAGFGGVSLALTKQQFFTVEVVGEPVTAYILWSGRDKVAAGVDPNINVSGSDGISDTITATIALDAESQNQNGNPNFSWLTQVYADVIEEGFPIINTGVNTFTVSGLDFEEPHGAGAIILSEGRDQCPFQAINLFYGDDVLFYKWPRPWGPHSDVTCVTFPSPPGTVEIDIQMFVGGVQNDKRANAIWYATGNGDWPDSLVGNTEIADNLIMPLKGLSGDEFDNYDTVIQNPDQRILASPGDTWACVQIESPECAVGNRECATPDPRFSEIPEVEQGISANWINLVTRMPLFAIRVAPGGARQVGESHTFTVTVDASFGMTTSNTLVITPTVLPAPTSMVDTCDRPIVTEKSASCTVTINSAVEEIYTTTAAAEIGFEDRTAYAFTNGVGDSSDPVTVTYSGESIIAAIDLEKSTNGENADQPPGPSLTVGDVVTWSYTVTNTGDVTLTEVAVTDDRIGAIECPRVTLGPLDTTTCTATGEVISGQYVNEAIVTARDPDGTVVSDLDRSTYIGGTPPTVGIHIEKATNGQDADELPGPSLIVGETVTWTYQVTNIGDLSLTEVTVTDDKLGPVQCPKTTLASQETMVCTETGLVEVDQYVNVATATGTGSNGTPTSHRDSSAYLGIVPLPIAIQIEKATNGEDADQSPGPSLIVGETVTWTYVVTNSGSITLTDVTVTDDRLGPIECPKTVLTPGESMNCVETGVVQVGQYRNEATASGQGPDGSRVEDMDASHYESCCVSYRLYLPDVSHNTAPRIPTLRIVELEVLSEHTVFENDKDIRVTGWKRDLTDCSDDNLARCQIFDARTNQAPSRENLELAPNRDISITVAVDRTDVELENLPPVVFELTHGEWITYDDDPGNPCSTNPAFASNTQEEASDSPGMKNQQRLPVVLNENGQVTFSATYTSCSRISPTLRQERHDLLTTCEHDFGDYRVRRGWEPNTFWSPYFPWDTLVVWLDLNGDGEPDATEPSCGLMIP